MIPLKKLNKYIIAISSMLMINSCGSNEQAQVASVAPAATNQAMAPAVITYDIINEYPHDPGAFTEGLEFKDGYLYESTGNYGRSDIRKTDIKTGKVLLSSKMEPRYFGEGLTILNGKIYQLTYKEGKGFVYDATTLKQERTFSFNTAEGWGMTNNGTDLIFDDGTNILHYIDPATFKEVKILAVTDEHGPVNEINELEMIQGFLYANQWETDYILKIDTTTGHVVARADLGNLRQRIGIQPPSGNPRAPEVLNGIAYDAATNRIFITGKNWPKLLEIKLDN